MAKTKKFEGSKYDPDKGMREGSKKDLKADAREARQMMRGYGSKGRKMKGG